MREKRHMKVYHALYVYSDILLSRIDLSLSLFSPFGIMPVMIRIEFADTSDNLCYVHVITCTPL